MTKPIHLTAGQVGYIRISYEAGLQVDTMAATLGVSPATIRRAFDTYEINTLEGKRKRLRPLISRLYSYRGPGQVAKEIGLSVTEVTKVWASCVPDHAIKTSGPVHRRPKHPWSKATLEWAEGVVEEARANRTEVNDTIREAWHIFSEQARIDAGNA
jgi:hypothetical protein